MTIADRCSAFPVARLFVFDQAAYNLINEPRIARASVYGANAPDAVRWYRPHLDRSLSLIESAVPDSSTAVIDKDYPHCRSVFSEQIFGKCVQPPMLCRISVLCLFAAFCASAQPAFPDTPAGRTLKAWFEAFNSGDRAKMEAYLQKFDPSRPLDGQMGFRNQTGGFDLLSIDKSEPTHIEFRVKEKASPTTAFGRLDVKDADPAEVVTFGLRAVPPGVTEADFKIDAAPAKLIQ